jgi:hypothetical protein
MPKKYITVQLEVDYELDEEFDPAESHYPEIIDSVLPVHIDASTLSPEELRAVYDYLRHADDASFDLIWDLKHLVSEARTERLT